ncbi:hypothetical protein JOB18_043340 [Solea senegalensis]|uniref:Uncharacterized protein n=1 Tax=Solea senegalensis TaxID=28829 RepID=A0AAV6QPK2_SOLSE|nr:hypothetical protein JOB18_043340 [Solea senegalensis]
MKFKLLWTRCLIISWSVFLSWLVFFGGYHGTQAGIRHTKRTHYASVLDH